MLYLYLDESGDLGFDFFAEKPSKYFTVTVLLVQDIPFEIYSLALNKKRVYDRLTQKKERFYNFIARKVLDVIPFDNATSRIDLIIDKSKSKHEIREFNQYLVRQLSGKIEPKIPLDIEHHLSHSDFSLQAVDLFSWGIFRKYEKKDSEWFNVFKKKVKYDSVYLP